MKIKSNKVGTVGNPIVIGNSSSLERSPARYPTWGRSIKILFQHLLNVALVFLWIYGLPHLKRSLSLFSATYCSEMTSTGSSMCRTVDYAVLQIGNHYDTLVGVIGGWLIHRLLGS